MKSILLSKWTKVVVFSACLVPLAILVWRGFHNNLTANPIEFITHTTGDWTMRFLILSLSISPLRKLLRQPLLIRYRRMLGLFAFFYVCLHFSTWIGLDKFFNWTEMLKDVQKRRFITVGFAGFVLLIPLAVTSTAGWIRRVGGGLRTPHPGVSQQHSRFYHLRHRRAAHRPRRPGTARGRTAPRAAQQGPGTRGRAACRRHH